MKMFRYEFCIFHAERKKIRKTLLRFVKGDLISARRQTNFVLQLHISTRKRNLSSGQSNSRIQEQHLINRQEAD